MFEALKKYADFDGRARRQEFWLFYLTIFLGYIVTAIFDILTGTFDEVSGAGLFSAIFFLAMIIPSIAVSIRRLHDLDRTGWWYLISIVPLVGPLVLLIFFCIPGTAGNNRFGPDPLSERKFP